ncbi:MAG TPA: hypothetical protein VE866_03810, partial [Candidatus Binatia bacterium]|nr:hypothetical protein [Candidatus Binatia bacterium]
MALLIWKEHCGSFDWGCDNCSFVVPKPEIGESIGEYIARSRNVFDEHDCQKYKEAGRSQSSRLSLV